MVFHKLEGEVASALGFSCGSHFRVSETVTSVEITALIAEIEGVDQLMGHRLRQVLFF
jgi:hypothetical protein